VKVKEPLLPEYAFLRPDLILFTYLHLAAERELTLEMMKKGVTESPTKPSNSPTDSSRC